MIIRDRIKQRRKELGLSAQDVAAALGVSRATIYRYESAEIEKIPITTLPPLAKVLQCSPAYLMGWEIDLGFYEDTFDKQLFEKLLAYYRLLSSENRETVVKRAEELLQLEEFRKSKKAYSSKIDFEFLEGINMVDFKDRVKEIRIARGYSQQGLADLMNVNKQTISQYERGVRFPDKDNLIALCDVLDVSADYLLGRTNINARIICERI